MARIGSFGAGRDPAPADEEHTVEWFGVDIRVDPDGATDLAYLDFMEQAMNVDEHDPKAATIVKTYLREIIHDDDFDTFWSLARKNRQTVQDLMVVVAEIVSFFSGRPPRPSSDSQSGQSPTAARSKDGSYSQAIEHLSGRPDLQNVVVMAAEARERRAG